MVHTLLVRATLSAKLIFGFLLVVIPLFSVMVAVSLYALRDLTSVNRELQEISRSLEAVQRLETAVAKAMTPISAYLVDGTAGEEQRFHEVIREVETRLRGCGATTCHGTSQKRGVMAESLVPYIQRIKERAQVVLGTGAPLAEQTKVRVLHDINRQGEEANDRLHRMSSALLLRVTALQEKSSEVRRRAIILTLATASLLLGLGAVSAYFLSRRLLKPVSALVTGTRHIMRGDLGYRVAVTERDEIGQLARSFNAMVQEIQEHREQLTRIVDARTAELRRAQESLVQSEKLASIGLLASGVAHELNNPLTSILLNVNLLIEDSGDQPAIQAELQRISEDTLRCRRIIDDLRNFSRPHELDVVHADLNALVAGAVELLQRGRELQGITVVSRLSSEIPVVPCDLARMEQVLGNVLVNAVQAMPEGGGLTISTGRRGDYAEITVQDTGPGVPDAVRSRIFDPFFTTKPHGTGLGLSIVYSIMQAHRGRVEVENVAPANPRAGSPPVGGARIVLLLPLGGSRAVNEAAPDTGG